MGNLDYVRAHSLDEAVSLLSESTLNNRILAGGTDLVNQLRQGKVSCDRLVDVAHVPELRVIQAGGPITIGAAVTHAEIAESLLLQEQVPILVQACRQIGSPQIRNIATIGGNVGNAAACADTLPVLVCLEARAIIVDAKGERSVPVTDLVTGVNRTLLPRDSLIQAFVFDPPPRGSRMSFQRVGRRRAMAIARLSLAAMGAIDDGRVALIRIVPGAAFTRFRRASHVEELLAGRQPTTDLISSAARRMADLLLEESGHRWSTPYKERVIAVLTERALNEVLEQ